MSKKNPTPPQTTERTRAAKAQKDAALKEALRVNLHKRKAQARAKNAQDEAK